MTKEGFMQFTAIAKATYSKENILNTPEALTVWMELLGDIGDEVALAALKVWINNNKWSPSISEIRETAYHLTHEKTSDWGEAWESVLKSIRKYGQYNEPKALETLDELTREVVNNLGFRNICITEEDQLGYLKRDFEKLYTLKAERKKREVLTGIAANSMNMIEGGTKEC